MKDLSLRKEFAKVSPAGLGVTKNGKLQFPLVLQVMESRNFPPEYNAYGQPRPTVGDFCSYALPSGLLTAGTVGKIIAEDTTPGAHDGTYTVQFLDGKTEECHRYGTGHLTSNRPGKCAITTSRPKSAPPASSAISGSRAARKLALQLSFPRRRGPSTVVYKSPAVPPAGLRRCRGFFTTDEHGSRGKFRYEKLSLYGFKSFPAQKV